MDLCKNLGAKDNPGGGGSAPRLTPGSTCAHSYIVCGDLVI